MKYVADEEICSRKYNMFMFINVPFQNIRCFYQYIIDTVEKLNYYSTFTSMFYFSDITILYLNN